MLAYKHRLIEEIEDMGALKKRSLKSYLEKLIEHLLKLKYWESEYEQNNRHSIIISLVAKVAFYNGF